MLCVMCIMHTSTVLLVNIDLYSKNLQSQDTPWGCFRQPVIHLSDCVSECIVLVDSPW